MDEVRLEELRGRLEESIRNLPEGFYDSFDFTTRGLNLCHPITVGLIAKVVGEMNGVKYVGIDVRLNNRKGQKFQPDVVAYANARAVERNKPMVFVDFESPNSSDGRYRTIICLNTWNGSVNSIRKSRMW